MLAWLGRASYTRRGLVCRSARTTAVVGGLIKRVPRGGGMSGPGFATPSGFPVSATRRVHLPGHSGVVVVAMTLVGCTSRKAGAPGSGAAGLGAPGPDAPGRLATLRSWPCP
jgi:hypothetical protein